jgi:uncharacterized SAM-binding protein YcdF (DUF218 family)
MWSICNASVAIVLLGSSDQHIQNDRFSAARLLQRGHPTASLWVSGTPTEVAAAQRQADVCPEMRSHNTAENAVHLAALLPQHTEAVWAVTSEFHMPRAQRILGRTWADKPWTPLYVSVAHVPGTAAGRAAAAAAKLEPLHLRHWEEDVEQASGSAP